MVEARRHPLFALYHFHGEQEFRSGLELGAQVAHPFVFSSGFIHWRGQHLQSVAVRPSAKPSGRYVECMSSVAGVAEGV